MHIKWNHKILLVKLHDSEMKNSFRFSRFSNGGWILDNFPRTREQWNVLVERNSLLPDDVIVLKDDSDKTLCIYINI